MLNGSFDCGAGKSRVPFHPAVPVVGANNTTGQDLFALGIEDPVGQQVSNILSHTKPESSTFH